MASSSPPRTPKRSQHSPRSSESSASGSSPLERLRSWSESFHWSSRTGSTQSSNDSAIAAGVLRGGMGSLAIGSGVDINEALHSNEEAYRGVWPQLINAGNASGAIGGLRVGRVWSSRLSEEQRTGAIDFAQTLHDTITKETEDKAYEASFETISLAESSMTSNDIYYDVQDEPPPSPDELREMNLFAYDDDKSEVSIAACNSEEMLQNQLDIVAYTHSGKRVHMKALLDTGAASNFMRLNKVRRTGYEIKPYRRNTLFSLGDGRLFRPIGEVVITWGINRPNNESDAKTYDIRFLVVEDDVEYDVILGFNFLRRAQFFTMNKSLCPLIPQRQSADVKAEVEESKKRQEERRAAEMKERRESFNKNRAGQSTASAGQSTGSTGTHHTGGTSSHG